ncbi:LuxR family transcriptional regulator [Trinickia sp. LjRoot230]|uniref:helix-turn-helix transcriptional regulator n=1 Tax=Trinickia sp. LjRoot230 TaxID=3342288 RepID=UPI003ECEFCEA
MKTSKSIQHSLLMLDGRQNCLPEFVQRSSTAGRSAIVDALSAANGPEQRRLVISATIGTIGFDWVCYWRLARTGDLMTRALYVREYSAPEWPEHYINERYIEVDPRVAFACQCEWPLIWDLNSLAQAPHAEKPGGDQSRLHSLLTDADRAALRSGVTFGLANPRSPFQSVICFSAANESREWISDRVVGQAYAVGLALHEYLLAHAPSLDEAPPTKPITQTQRKILAALTQGLSDKEIADVLGTSAYNVDYHLRQLKRRYGAQNRVHLAYLAGCRDDWRQDCGLQRNIARATSSVASNAPHSSTVA